MTTDKLHSTDQVLLEVVAGKRTDGLVELTPELSTAIGDNLRNRIADINERYPKLVEECPYETRLAVAAWIISVIVDHAISPGSFRYLIYDRLGFGPDAYVSLYNAGGMTLTNEFDLGEIEELRELNKKLQEKLRQVSIGRVISRGKYSNREHNPFGCHICGYEWYDDEPENHANDCLATPKKDQLS